MKLGPPPEDGTQLSRCLEHEPDCGELADLDKMLSKHLRQCDQPPPLAEIRCRHSAGNSIRQPEHRLISRSHKAHLERGRNQALVAGEVDQCKIAAVRGSATGFEPDLGNSQVSQFVTESLQAVPARSLLLGTANRRTNRHDGREVDGGDSARNATRISSTAAVSATAAAIV